MKRLLSLTLILFILLPSRATFAQSQDSDVIKEIVSEMSAEEIYTGLEKAISEALKTGAIEWVENKHYRGTKILKIDEELTNDLEGFVSELSTYPLNNIQSISGSLGFLNSFLDENFTWQVNVLTFLAGMGSVTAGLYFTQLGYRLGKMAKVKGIVGMSLTFIGLGILVVLAGTILEELFASASKPYQQYLDHPEYLCPPDVSTKEKSIIKEMAIEDMEEYEHLKEAIFKYGLYLNILTLRAQLEKS